MKKWVMLLVVCLSGVSALAQSQTCRLAGVNVVDRAVHANEYTDDELEQKVRKMERIELSRMPGTFQYQKYDRYLENQQQINIFYLAKSRYEKNPGNFNAVYNYAVIIMSESWTDGGISISDRQVDEAYKIFEKAKKMRPDFLQIYEHQDFLVEYRIFGPQWIGPCLEDAQIIAAYRAHPDLARRRLALQEKLLANGSGNVVAAWHLCEALGYKARAQKYHAIVEQFDAEQKARWEQQRKEEEARISAEKKSNLKKLKQLFQKKSGK